MVYSLLFSFIFGRNISTGFTIFTHNLFIIIYLIMFVYFWGGVTYVVMLNCHENVKMQFILIFLKLNFIYGLQNVIFVLILGRNILNGFMILIQKVFLITMYFILWYVFYNRNINNNIMIYLKNYSAFQTEGSRGIANGFYLVLVFTLSYLSVSVYLYVCMYVSCFF